MIMDLIILQLKQVYFGVKYKIVDNYSRIIVGGADPSVGPGGYSLGGGHSPISPSYGLSSDWTLEYFMIDSNSNILHIYNTSVIIKQLIIYFGH